MSKLPQKSFDSQLHIIRDVHFDVSKYKIGELYVINHMIHPNYLHFGEPCKTVGYLKTASEHSLQFRTMKRCDICNDTDAVYYTYTIDDFTLTIDEIIDKEIEIERLLTETEAAMYLSTTVLENAKDSLTLNPSDPKFNRLLGIGKSSHDAYWSTPQIIDKYESEIKPSSDEKSNSYFPSGMPIPHVEGTDQSPAAYKIDKDDDKNKACMNVRKLAEDATLRFLSEQMKYVVNFRTIGKRPIFTENWYFDTDILKELSGHLRIKLKRGESTIQIYTSAKNVLFERDTWIVKNPNATTQFHMKNTDARFMFDNITIDNEQ